MATLIMQGDSSGQVRRCDATCHNAKHPRCSCICGGRYHGKGSNSPELAQAVKDFTTEVFGRTEQGRQVAQQLGLSLNEP
jgi:hypothetical protein